MQNCSSSRLNYSHQQDVHHRPPENLSTEPTSVKIAWHVHCSLTLTSPPLFGLDTLAWPAAMNELCHLLFVCERALVWVMATATHQLFSLAPAANARVRLTSHMTNQLNSKWGVHPQGHLRHVQAFSLFSFPAHTKILWHTERGNS